MSPKAPQDPQKGKAAEQEQIEAEAAEAKAQTGGPPDEPPKPRRRRRAAAKKEDAGAQEPASDETPAEQPDAEPVAEAAKTEAKPAPRRRRAPAAKAAEDAAEPAPKPAPRRTRTPAAQRRAVVRARARYVRTSARKARMVSGHIRGKSVEDARAILAFTPREVAVAWSKLLESAVANAENNHELVGDDLVVRDAFADEGPTIKRFRPRAMGRATPIRKRTSHLTITLTPKP